MSSTSSYMENIPPDITYRAAAATNNLLPEKSSKTLILVVLQQLSSSSCRSITVEDSGEKSEDDIAHILLPLLGPDVKKNDIKVQVVPYKQYKDFQNSKRSAYSKHSASTTPVKKQKPDVPVAIILADPNFKNRNAVVYKGKSKQVNFKSLQNIKEAVWKELKQKREDSNESSDLIQVGKNSDLNEDVPQVLSGEVNVKEVSKVKPEISKRHKYNTVEESEESKEPLHVIKKKGKSNKYDRIHRASLIDDFSSNSDDSSVADSSSFYSSSSEEVVAIEKHSHDKNHKENNKNSNHISSESETESVEHAERIKEQKNHNSHRNDHESIIEYINAENSKEHSEDTKEHDGHLDKQTRKQSKSNGFKSISIEETTGVSSEDISKEHEIYNKNHEYEKFVHEIYESEQISKELIKHENKLSYGHRKRDQEISEELSDAVSEENYTKEDKHIDLRRNAETIEESSESLSKDDIQVSSDHIIEQPVKFSNKHHDYVAKKDLIVENDTKEHKDHKKQHKHDESLHNKHEQVTDEIATEVSSDDAKIEVAKQKHSHHKKKREHHIINREDPNNVNNVIEQASKQSSESSESSEEYTNEIDSKEKYKHVQQSQHTQEETKEQSSESTSQSIIDEESQEIHNQVKHSKDLSDEIIEVIIESVERSAAGEQISDEKQRQSYSNEKGGTIDVSEVKTEPIDVILNNSDDSVSVSHSVDTGSDEIKKSVTEKSTEVPKVLKTKSEENTNKISNSDENLSKSHEKSGANEEPEKESTENKKERHEKCVEHEKEHEAENDIEDDSLEKDLKYYSKVIHKNEKPIIPAEVKHFIHENSEEVKIIDKLILDSISNYVKRQGVIEAKNDQKTKTYNLSFSFNKR